jgi:hypothetical protein
VLLLPPPGLRLLLWHPGAANEQVPPKGAPTPRAYGIASDPVRPVNGNTISVTASNPRGKLLVALPTRTSFWSSDLVMGIVQAPGCAMAAKASLRQRREHRHYYVSADLREFFIHDRSRLG